MARATAAPGGGRRRPRPPPAPRPRAPPRPPVPRPPAALGSGGAAGRGRYRPRPAIEALNCRRCRQVKPTFSSKCPSRRFRTPPPAQCTINARRMMTRITTTSQKKNTTIPGIAYPATDLALATASSYPAPPDLSFAARQQHHHGGGPLAVVAAASSRPSRTSRHYLSPLKRLISLVRPYGVIRCGNTRSAVFGSIVLACSVFLLAGHATPVIPQCRLACPSRVS